MNSSRTAAASGDAKARISISFVMEAPPPLLRPYRRVLQAVIVIGLAQRAVRRRFRHEFGDERESLAVAERDGDGGDRLLERLVEHFCTRNLLRHLVEL